MVDNYFENNLTQGHNTKQIFKKLGWLHTIQYLILKRKRFTGNHNAVFIAALSSK